LRKNFDEFSLDLKTGQWDVVTHRNWREFLIRLEPRMEQIHRNAEAVLGGSCVLEQLSPEYQLLNSG
jgi:hypothetical protein